MFSKLQNQNLKTGKIFRFIEDYQLFEESLRSRRVKFDKNFFVFEGSRDTGKETQIQCLKKTFEDRNIRVVVTSEPEPVTSKGLQLRSLLLEKDVLLDPYEESILLLLSRYNHVNSFIKPHLEEGYIVLCKRYIASTYIYQVYAGELNFFQFSSFYPFKNFLMPANTIVLRAPYKIIKKRCQQYFQQESQLADRMSRKKKEDAFQRKILNGYSCLKGQGYHAIDGSRTIEEVSQNIRELNCIQEILKEHQI